MSQKVEKVILVFISLSLNPHQSKDDLKDWGESGSDQDDIMVIYDRFFSQDDSKIQTDRETPLFLTSGSQSVRGSEEVPDPIDPKITSRVENEVTILGG